MRKTKLILTSLFALYVAPLLARAQARDSYGLYDAASGAGLLDTNVDVNSLPARIGVILFSVISFLGVLFLVIVVYAGFLWMTSGGSAERTGKAAALMRNGFIGILIVLLSYAITSFVFKVILAS